jgi:hypothetical protein
MEWVQTLVKVVLARFGKVVLAHFVLLSILDPVVIEWPVVVGAVADTERQLAGNQAG